MMKLTLMATVFMQAPTPVQSRATKAVPMVLRLTLPGITAWQYERCPRPQLEDEGPRPHSFPIHRCLQVSVQVAMLLVKLAMAMPLQWVVGLQAAQTSSAGLVSLVASLQRRPALDSPATAAHFLQPAALRPLRMVAPPHCRLQRVQLPAQARKCPVQRQREQGGAFAAAVGPV